MKSISEWNRAERQPAPSKIKQHAAVKKERGAPIKPKDYRAAAL